MKSMPYAGVACALWIVALASAPPAQGSDFETCLSARNLPISQPEEAAAACRNLAAKGVPWAQYQMGYLYYSGQGVEQNYALAKEWFEKAMAGGDAAGGTMIGFMYEYGIGVPQDFRRAFGWYTQSALRGNPDAQYLLGLMYRSGRGVEPDKFSAFKWVMASVKQDSNHLQYSPGLATLGEMYEQGDGVPQDYVEAHRWYSLAAYAAQSEKGNKSLVDFATKARDRLAASMTSEQITEAQRLAQEWESDTQ